MLPKSSILKSSTGGSSGTRRFVFAETANIPRLSCSAKKNNSNKDVVHAKGLLNINGSLNEYMNIVRYVSLRDSAAQAPPNHLPPVIDASFIEASMCLAIGCWNAAGVMFRMCVDRATKPMLPEDETPGLNAKTRRDLGLRLPWLFDNGFLPEGLRELSTCIREDGNDGAHAGTLTKEDAVDLLDFTTVLLERLYTEPERLKLAKERRQARRS
jgi:hypothetical protein